MKCTYIKFLAQKPIFLTFLKHFSGVSEHGEFIPRETKFKKYIFDSDFITICMALITNGAISPISGQNINLVSRQIDSSPSLVMEITLEKFKTSTPKGENGQGGSCFNACNSIRDSHTGFPQVK